MNKKKFSASWVNTHLIYRVIKKIVLSGAMVLFFSFGCSKADAPSPSPGNGSSQNGGSDNGSTSDDHGNDRASATPVTIGTPVAGLGVGAPVAGNIETDGDVDYFSIQVPGDGILGASTAGEIDTFGTIYDTDGNGLVNDDDITRDNTNFEVSDQIIDAGTYYIRVRSRGGETGEYNLTVTFTPNSGSGESIEIDDYGDDISSAAPVTSSWVVPGNLETSDDEDYFSIPVGGVGTIQAITTGNTDTIGYLYDSDGNELTSDDDGGMDENFNFSYDVTSAGFYYVGVKTFSDTGMYNLTITFTLSPP